MEGLTLTQLTTKVDKMQKIADCKDLLKFLLEKISQLEQKLKKKDDTLEKINQLEIKISEKEVTSETKITSLEEKVNQMENSENQNKKEESNSENVYPFPKQQRDDRKINSIVIADSNHKFINPAGVGTHENRAIIVRCYTIKEIPECIKKKNDELKLSPKNVLIATGTNDIDEEPTNVVMTNLNNAVITIKEIWPNCNIKIQKLLCRKDGKETEINDEIEKFATANKLFILRPNIKVEDLHDNKHVLKEKIKTLALSWKFALNGRSRFFHNKPETRTDPWSNQIMMKNFAEMMMKMLNH